jgi:hypothetical protein
VHRKRTGRALGKRKIPSETSETSSGDSFGELQFMWEVVQKHLVVK